MPARPETTVPVPVDPSGRDPITIGEALRAEHPVVPLADGGWMILGHEEAMRAATDPETFSSAVSAHLQIPNGLDGPVQQAFRRVIDPFFDEESMAELEPRLRTIARDLADELAARGPDGIDAVGEIGSIFAVRAQTSWLGWPSALEPRLLEWMAQNHAASRSGDPLRTGAVAADFDRIIREIVQPRLADPAASPDDVTGRLLRATVQLPGEAPRPLAHEEIVSVLRNWTAGDLGSIALCVGVVLEALARRPELADRIRAGASRSEVAAIIDELLRRDDPFVANRRVARCPVSIGGQRIEARQKVVIQWTSANRDPQAIADPDGVDPEANAAANLVYGIGPHVCPGRPLATLELCVLIEELLCAFPVLELDPAIPAEREVTPVGGYARVGIRLVPAGASA